MKTIEIKVQIEDFVECEVEWEGDHDEGVLKVIWDGKDITGLFSGEQLNDLGYDVDSERDVQDACDRADQVIHNTEIRSDK